MIFYAHVEHSPVKNNETTQKVNRTVNDEYTKTKQHCKWWISQSPKLKITHKPCMPTTTETSSSQPRESHHNKRFMPKKQHKPEKGFIPIFPAALLMTTTCPLLRSVMCGMTHLVSDNPPSTFNSSNCRSTSSDVCAQAARWLRPALFTKTSIWKAQKRKWEKDRTKIISEKTKKGQAGMTESLSCLRSLYMEWPSPCSPTRNPLWTQFKCNLKIFIFPKL